MCMICDIKKKQSVKLRQIADLIVKRDLACIFNRPNEAAEIKPIIVELMDEVLNLQDGIPTIEGGDPEMIICLIKGLLK